MISIRKYLYASRGGAGSAESGSDMASISSETLCPVCDRLFDLIALHVFQAESELGAQWRELSAAMRQGLDGETAAQMEESATRLLAAHRLKTQQDAIRTAAEMQNILRMLNQALMVLAGRSERSVARLRDVQDTLLRASQVEDIVALKAVLAETLRFVQQESVREQEAASQELTGFRADIGTLKQSLTGTRMLLPGRPEGVHAISEALQPRACGQPIYAIAFLLDRLRAIAQRYGPPVADELLLRLITERLQPISPAGAAFRWTQSSLVAVFEESRPLPELQNAMANLNRAPLVHRLELGARTAVLTLSPSHLIAQGVPGSPEPLIQEVDRFTGFTN